MAEVEILGTTFTATRFEDAVNRMLVAARGQRPFRVYFANVHTTVEAQRNPRLRAAMSSAGMVCTDGMPLVWLVRRRGAPDAERVSGPDAMLAVCDRGRDLGLRHYFFGGGPGVAAQVAARLVERFPGLIVAGTYTPPFGVPAQAEDEVVINKVNETTPDVVWVALGAPKQELWTAANADRLTAGVVLPVGAAFDFHGGRIRRAPRWMRRLGLEWLFRLARQPRRLAGRYLGTNTRFVWLLTRERLAGRRGSLDTDPDELRH